jgi:hypothetical protein
MEALLRIDLSDFELSVDLSAVTDLTALSSDQKSEVQDFAADVGTSFAAGVASATEGVDPSDVEVTCVYRDFENSKTDLLTLTGTCGERRLDGARRLAATGFVVEATITATQALVQAAADAAESAPITVVSGGMTGSATVTARLGESTATPPPTPAPTSKEPVSSFASAIALVCFVW